MALVEFTNNQAPYLNADNLNNNFNELNNKINNFNMIKLWENENPASNFAAQTINLSSDDYDYLMFFFVNGAGFGMTLKGQNYIHGFAWDYNGGSGNTYYAACFRRNFARVSNTEYNVSDCYVRYGNNTSNNTVNDNCKPLVIYGGKFGGQSNE